MLKPKKFFSDFLHKQREKFHAKKMEKVKKTETQEPIRIPRPQLQVNSSKIEEYLDYKSRLQPTVNITCRICGHFNTPPAIHCRVCAGVYHISCIQTTTAEIRRHNWACHFCECIWLILPDDEKHVKPCLPCVSISRQVFNKIWPVDEHDDRRDYFDELDVENEGKVSYKVYLIAFTLIRLKEKPKMELVKYLTTQEVLSLRNAFSKMDAQRGGFLTLNEAQKVMKMWLESYGVHVTLSELYSSKTIFNVNGNTAVSWRDFLLSNTLNAISLRPNFISPKTNFLWLVN